MLEGEHVPAPVTSATLPSSDADARPRGPGIWSYLPSVVVVSPGILLCSTCCVVSGGGQGVSTLASDLSRGDLFKKAQGNKVAVETDARQRDSVFRWEVCLPWPTDGEMRLYNKVGPMAPPLPLVVEDGQYIGVSPGAPFGPPVVALETSDYRREARSEKPPKRNRRLVGSHGAASRPQHRLCWHLQTK